MPEPNLVAALVILAGAPTDPTAATARSIEALRPAAEVVERARRAFESLGFRSHPGAGHAFSIEADADRFEATFKVHLTVRDDGGMRVASATGQTLSSLPLDALPATLRPQLDAIVFSEPPAFGPGPLP
jgi:hypothetical protein